MILPPESPQAPPPAPRLDPEKPSLSALRAAVREGRLEAVVQHLAQISPLRRAELFIQLRPPEQKAILLATPTDLGASILADCDSGSLAAALVAIDLAAIAPTLRLIPPDNLADIALHLPPKSVEELLALADPPLRDEVRRLMAFDPNTAGGLMTTRYFSIPGVVTAGKALEILRDSKPPEIPHYIYTVDARGRLLSVTTLKQLLLATPRQLVRSVAKRDVVRVAADTPRDQLVTLFNEYHYVALPVVDDKSRLIGVVTFDDVMNAMRRDERELVRSMTGGDPREVWKETLAATRGRVPWVTVTIAAGLAGALIGAFFQRALSEYIVLGLFIPAVLALGESIGAQTASVVLTVLITGNITRREMKGFLLKELGIGAIVGLYAGAVVTAASLFWHGNPRLGLLIGAAILVSVSWAAMLGVLIPTLLRRLRMDPTVASGPVVLALVDISTLFVYFGGATLFLRFLGG